MVSVIAVISVIVLGSLQIIGIPLAAILSASISVIGIAVSLIGDLNKPKISLQIEKPVLKRREYGDYHGYKMVTKVTNEGDKIVFNLEASAKFEEQIEVSNVKIQTTNNRKSYSSSNQPFEENKYSWIDSNGKPIGNLISQLRKDDKMKLMFPTEYKLGDVWVIALNANFEPTSRNNTANDTLLNLEPQKTYNIEIKLKGEDNDKITVTEKKKFKIKTP